MHAERTIKAGSKYFRVGSKAGDSRWMAAPFLAHQHYTSAGEQYRWMLFGDDDTVFLLQVCTPRLSNTSQKPQQCPQTVVTGQYAAKILA